MGGGRGGWPTVLLVSSGAGPVERNRVAIVVGISLIVCAMAIAGALALRSGDSSNVESAGAESATTLRPTTTAPRATSTTTIAPTTTTTEPRGPLGSGEPVTFAFGGDSHFESHLRYQLDTNPTGMLAPMMPLFEGADLSMLNLETAITERGTPAAKEFTFRAPATAFDALRAGGIDVVTMANNHGLDFGPEGLQDALAASAASGFPVIGIGQDAAEAYRPHTTIINGQRIAIIGATQVLDDHLIAAWTDTDTQPGMASAKEVDRLLAEVRAAREVADTVIVYLHWGLERETCPTDVQKGLAPQLLEAGADIVVGGHAHRVQSAGRMGDGFIAYGLGNFIWQREDGVSGESGVLHVTATGRQIDSYEWRPARITNGIPTPLEGDAKIQAVAAWDALRACTDLVP